MEEGRECGAALVRSATRVEILNRLEDGPATRYELRAELDCSRTTVDRNLDRLVEAGWIERGDAGYAITTPGAVVLEQALAFVETVGAASRLQPILRHLPRAALDIDIRHLADAEVTLAGDVTPLEMVDRHIAALEGCSRCRAMLPITSAKAHEVICRRTQSGDMVAEVVVNPEVAEVFLTHPQFVDGTTEARDSGTFSVSVTDEPIPYYAGVLDESVQVGVDEDGEPRGLLETDADPVRAWADRTIDRYLDAAVSLAAWERERGLADG